MYAPSNLSSQHLGIQSPQHAHLQQPGADTPSVMRDFTLPITPMLAEEDDGWAITESGRQQAAHTMTDVIMSSSNGCIGVKGNTELVDAVVQNHVVVAGCVHRVAEDHPAPSAALPTCDEYLPDCYVVKVQISDGSSQCMCKEMLRRTLDLRTGTTTFTAIMHSANVTFTMQWQRFVSLQHHPLWWAELRISDVVVGGDMHPDQLVVAIDVEYAAKLWSVQEVERNARRGFVHLESTLHSTGQQVVHIGVATCEMTEEGSLATAASSSSSSSSSSSNAVPLVMEPLATQVIVPMGTSPTISPRVFGSAYSTSSTAANNSAAISSPSSSDFDGGLAGTGMSSLAPEAEVTRLRRKFVVPLSRDRQCGESGDALSESRRPLIIVTLCSATARSDMVDVHELSNRLDDCATNGYAAALEAQRQALGQLWGTLRHEVVMQDDPHVARLQMSMRYNTYVLYTNSLGCGPYNGIHRNGLTCDGPQGQISFHDYLYFGLFWCLNVPSLAAALLSNVYHNLPSARRLATRLSIPKGAIFPSRTISGHECGTYFLNSTARFHINADIAYIIGLYMQVETPSREQQLQNLEVLLETARVWLFLGSWQDGHTTFTIDDVVGPDGYAGLVNNSFYTNLAAKRHLHSAWELGDAMLNSSLRSETLLLLERIEMSEALIAEMYDAAAAIVLHRDDRHGIYFAHEHFDTQPPWPDRGGPIRYPLSLNYHPLVIYRHKVCQLPDVLLGMLLNPERFERSDFRKNLHYYEPLCTGDDPMSLAVLTATKFRAWGDFGKGTGEFKAAVQLDTESLLPVADEGLHLSAMTSGWFILAFGVCKMKIQKATLHFSPDLPVGWESCVLTVRWRQALIRVTVLADSVRYELVEGSTARLVHFDTTRVHMHSGTTDVRPCTTAVFPRAVKQHITTHFDGVIFTLEAIVENLGMLHFCAWRNVLEAFFTDVRERECRAVPSLTYEEYVEEVLYQVEQSELQYTGLHRLLLARGIELDIGNPTDVEIVETRFGLANAKLAEMNEVLQTTELRLVEGVRDLLHDLRRLGLRVAVVSFTRSMGEVMRLQPILSNLSTTTIDGVEAREKKFRGRPHTDLFVKAAQKMHLKPDRCVVIGCEFDRGYKLDDLQVFHVVLDVLREGLHSPAQPNAHLSRLGPSLGGTPLGDDPISGRHQLLLGTTPTSVGSDAFAPVINVPAQNFPCSVAVLEDWIIERQRRRRVVR